MAWILTWVVGILESRVGLGGCADAGGCVVVRALGVQDVVPGISAQPSLSGVLFMCGGVGLGVVMGAMLVSQMWDLG